jgi:(2R)-ethylmalonyl-CoA mutase
LANLDAMGGAIAAIDYMKARLVESNAARVNGIERGETVVVGVNKYTASEPSPLMGEDGGIMVVDPAVEAGPDRAAERVARRARRRCGAALADLRAAAPAEGRNVMPASIAAAKAGVTTGEWAGVMRAVHGEYRGPTGVSKAVSNQTEGLDDIRDAVDAVSDRLGRRLKFLVGKPGLDGHSNGAEQIAFGRAIAAWTSPTRASA